MGVSRTHWRATRKLSQISIATPSIPSARSNEPLITCLFSADIGLWPPHGRGRESYVHVLSRVAQGLSRSIRVLRRLSPQTRNRSVRCPLEHPTIEAKAAEIAGPELMQQLQDDLNLRLHRRHVVLDLVIGQDRPGTRAVGSGCKSTAYRSLTCAGFYKTRLTLMCLVWITTRIRKPNSTPAPKRIFVNASRPSCRGYTKQSEIIGNATASR